MYMIKTKSSIVLIAKCRKAIFTGFLALIILKSNAQAPPVNYQTYVDIYASEAVNQMAKYKIPASVILAQAIFESNCGNSALAKKSNNHFGIKCHIEWSGDTIVKNDDALNECFRKYNSIEDSYTDHSIFLSSRVRYAHLFNLKLTDYKGWCHGLKYSGYATYPAYAKKLINIIEDYKLYEFDGAEKMEIINYSNLTGENLKVNYFSLNDITLRDFVRSDALFIEERDVLIQCLDLIIEDEVPEIAENYKYCKPAILNGSNNM